MGLYRYCMDEGLYSHIWLLLKEHVNKITVNFGLCWIHFPEQGQINKNLHPTVSILFLLKFHELIGFINGLFLCV